MTGLQPTTPHRTVRVTYKFQRAVFRAFRTRYSVDKVSAPEQGVFPHEVRGPILVERDHLAIDHEMHFGELQRGRDDEREAIGPVTAASTDQTHT
jgi:hypothetical protein